MRNLQEIAMERQRINQIIRSFFIARGYVEVETPILVQSPGMEPELIPFETTVISDDETQHTAALITSPEYSMKKLLGRGFEKIFTITKVFRNGEAFGGTHNPEFSMLEWYCQGEDYHACMNETEALIQKMENAFSVPPTEIKRATVADLFAEYVGIDVRSLGCEELSNACFRHGIHFTKSDSISDLFFRLFLSKIEPQLLNTFVYDYPLYQASLSRITKDGLFGERFELYLNGLELCNGFTELTDAVEQKKRFENEARERQAYGKTVHPIDEELISLLPSIREPTYGNALGIDRLHMALTKREKIEDVLLFSYAKPQ